MQQDMHYYGTYVLACAAGIPAADAQTIAFSAQWVDDQDFTETTEFDDGAAIAATATAHHPVDAGLRAEFFRRAGSFDDARQVWVPFHFLPGNEGETFQQRLVCKKNSKTAHEMLTYHLGSARDDFGLHLAGIAAHVFSDTFAHYGFLGIRSSLNDVDAGTLEFDNISPSVRNYFLDQKERFKRHVIDTPLLGHGGVATNPDRPYLKWRFKYADGRDSGLRDNPATFWEACQELYAFFRKFSQAKYESSNLKVVPLDEISGEIQRILSLHLPEEERSQAWISSLEQRGLSSIPLCKEYFAKDWGIPKVDGADHLLRSNFYKFHQAADYHRSYVLRVLLPKVGLVVA